MLQVTVEFEEINFQSRKVILEELLRRSEKCLEVKGHKFEYLFTKINSLIHFPISIFSW